jgi:FkbM family methyltransferase
VGPTGQILSFEPHPQVFERLRTNWNNLASKLRITASESAVGLTDGYAELIEPSGFEENEGTASIASASFTECSLRGSQHRVSIRRLDSMFSGDQEFGLMKVDVEGAEADVFRGAERLLSEKRFKDIVWEDHHVFPSDSVQLLSRHGYRIYRFTKSIFGPKIWDPFESTEKQNVVPWETINFLATTQASRAASRLKPRGWRCLE